MLFPHDFSQDGKTDLHVARSIAPKISVLVTARNYARFLEECLESVLHQTLTSVEIIYCDDGSDDDSVQVASRFADVKVVELRHRGVARARNAAVHASSGEYLVHVDGDDVLPPDYLEKHYLALCRRPDCVFAYGAAQAFGAHDTLWAAPEWDRSKLWRRNFVNTSAMYRRWAFKAAGQWRQGLGTCWDWDLALRVSRLGPGILSDAVLGYRQHSDSWSNRLRSQLETKEFSGELLGSVRRLSATTTIASILSGRLPTLFTNWIASVAESVRNTEGLRPDLLLLDNSNNESFRSKILEEAGRFSDCFNEIRYMRHDVRFEWQTESDRRDRVAEFMTGASNRVLEHCHTDVLWFIEDDIIVPQNAYSDLLQILTDGMNPKAAVSGVYRSRHDASRYVAHFWDEEPIPLRTVPGEPSEIDVCGTGCLMLFRPLASHRFESHVNGIPAHDWAWCTSLRLAGHRVMLDPRVSCRHYVDADSFT